MKLISVALALSVAVVSAEALNSAGLRELARTAPAADRSQSQVGNAPGAPRPRREILPIERAKIVAALPAKAPAKPRGPRKLLIFDGSANHPSVPYADLAMQLMGEKTGAFTTTISDDSSVLQAESLKQYDAVYLNNNVGTTNDVFGTPELRQGFLAYVSNGGGVVASHGNQRGLSQMEGIRRASWRLRRVASRIGRKGHCPRRGPGSSDYPGIRWQVVRADGRVLPVPGAILAREVTSSADR
jgi:Trehalose utilisation